MGALVAIVMGSSSDSDKVAPAEAVLEELGIEAEVKVLSAHRDPEAVRDFALSCRERGIEVIIAAAGKAAHLAGTIAAWTTLPVIGIPISSADLGGLDALLSTVQMPRGVPVATVAIDGAMNAGLLAARILANKRPELISALESRRTASK
ncbi:MAG: 5-(carboxyamino)imidazole ribonucleotide mutase [Candidatus Geothermincolia bacterium]